MKNQERNHNAVAFVFPFKVENLISIGLPALAFWTIAYCVWTLDRGFELTDEAYYLLVAMHGGSQQLYVGAQHWITAGIWRIARSIMMFRADGMVILLSSAALFSFGAFSACRRYGVVLNNFKAKAVVLSAAMVGAMLYASIGINFSPCYNLLTAAGAYAAAGLVLLALTRSRITHQCALFFIAGCALGVEFICKFPSGIATLILLFFWTAILGRSHFEKVSGLLSIIFGIFIFSITALLANTTITDAIQAVEKGFFCYRLAQGESVGLRLVRYYSEFREYLRIVLLEFLVPIVSMIVYATTRRAVSAYLGLAALVITLIFGNSSDARVSILPIHDSLFGSYLFGGYPLWDMQVVALFAMLVMALIVSIPLWCRNMNVFALFLGFILLPYSAAMGSGNVLFAQVIMALAPWGVLVAALMVSPHRDPLPRRTIAILGICFIGTMALQTISSGSRPYRLSAPLTKQDQTVEVGAAGKVKVDGNTYTFFKELKMAIKACDIAPAAPFIGLYNIPGVAIGLQAIPVLTPWLFNRRDAEFVIENGRLKGSDLALVGLAEESGGVFPPLPKQLDAFPSGYEYCGATTHPKTQEKIQIWKSLRRNSAPLRAPNGAL